MAQYSPGTIALHNGQSIKLLSTLIQRSQRCHQLILACCNDVRWHRRIIRKVQGQCSVPLQPLRLPRTARSLQGELQTNPLSQTPQGALMVLGLDALPGIHRFLLASDLEYQSGICHPPMPVVLWVTDAAIAKMVQFAPVLAEQASQPVRFWAIASDVTQPPQPRMHRATR